MAKDWKEALSISRESCGRSEPRERRLGTWASWTELNSSTVCCVQCANPFAFSYPVTWHANKTLEKNIMHELTRLPLSIDIILLLISNVLPADLRWRKCTVAKQTVLHYLLFSKHSSVNVLAK